MIRALDIIGPTGAAHLYLRRAWVIMAPVNVAILPNTISGSAQPVKMLLRRQPINRPGIADEVK